MAEALRLARRGLGYTSPNPAVGALVVKDGRVVGRGYHQHFGGPHAEAVALAEAGARARGSTVYVTLEPCGHHGKTPPCTEALLAAGVRRVCYGMSDPDPQVAGEGVAQLRRGGVEVLTGPLADEVKRFYEAYAKHRRTGKPFVTLKMALSLDGKIATREGDSHWISSEAARAHTHRLRAEADAVMVGVGTILSDDPALTTRLPEGRGRDAAAVIVDSRARTPPGASVFRRQAGSAVYIGVTEAAEAQRLHSLEAQGARIVCCQAQNGRVDLGELLARLGELGMLHVMCEGGGALAASLLEAGLVDKVLFVVAPKLIGGRDAPTPVEGVGPAAISEALDLRDLRVERVGPDVLLEGYVCSPES